MSRSPWDSQEKGRGHRKGCRLGNPGLSLSGLRLRQLECPRSRSLSYFPQRPSCPTFSLSGAVAELCLLFQLCLAPQSLVAARPHPRAAEDPGSLLITVLDKPDAFAALTLIFQHRQGQICRPLDM